MRSRKSFRLATWALYGFFVLLLFEGAVRKWVVSGYGVELQIFRDLLPAIALAAYLGAAPSARHAASALPVRPVLVLFVAYFFVACATALLSGQEGAAIPLLGIRTHFAYVPLAFLMPALFDRDRLDSLLRTMVYLAIPICVLAVYQSTQPSNSLINIYGDGEASDAVFGSRMLVRATGTFSYITGMGYYAQFAGAAAFYLAMSSRSPWRSALAFSGLAMAMAGGLATGSRAALLGLFVQVLLMLAFSRPLRARFRRHFARNALTTVVVAAATYAIAGEQMEAFLERTRDVSDDVGWRVGDVLLEWLVPLARDPLGLGIGRGHQQAAVLIGGTAGFGGYGALPEAELSRIALELGFLGFVLFVLFRLACYVTAFFAAVRARGAEESLLAGLAFSTLIVLGPGGLYTPMANALFWLSLGCVQLVRNEDRRLRAMAGSSVQALQHRWS